MRSILIVDDDHLSCENTQKLLKKFGWQVETVCCIDDAYHRAENTAYTLILVEVNVGQEHGRTLVCQLRALGITTPIVVYTAHESERYLTGALDAGADDYILKSTSVPIFTARLEAHFRREQRRDGRNGKLVSQRRVAIGRLVLDREAHVLEVGEMIIKLHLKEIKIVDLLASDPDRVFPMREILENICGRDYLMSKGALHSVVSRLRRKLEECGLEGLIENHHAKGFRLVERIAAQAGRLG
jgi:DNA-binding response OmpR family regulator